MWHQTGLGMEVLAVSRHPCRIEATWVANHARFATPERLYRLQVASLIRPSQGSSVRRRPRPRCHRPLLVAKDRSVLESISIAFHRVVALILPSSVLAIALFNRHAARGTMCGNAE